MSDEEYGFDDIDALAAFLDEDEMENPYDDGSTTQVGNSQPLPVNRPGTSTESTYPEKTYPSEFKEDGDKEEADTEGETADEEKSKEELLVELFRLRKQLKQLKNAQTEKSVKCGCSSSQELFSEALSSFSQTPVDSRKLNASASRTPRTLNSRTSKRNSQSKQKPEKQESITKGVTEASGKKVETKPRSQFCKSKVAMDEGDENSKDKDLKAASKSNSQFSKQMISKSEEIGKPTKNDMVDTKSKEQQSTEGKSTGESSKKSFQEIFVSLVSSDEEENEVGNSDICYKAETDTNPVNLKDQSGTMTENNTTSKKSFKDMFGTLGSSDEETDGDLKSKKSLNQSPTIKKEEEPEEKSSNLAGGNNSFYQKKKRVAHTPKNLGNNLQKSKDFQQSRFPASSQGKSPGGRLTSQEHWEVEPYTQIRISNPVVSMKSLKEKMANRKIARLCILKRFIKGGEVEGDWVTIGVLISKSSPKTSKNGKQFSVWKLNDLSPHCPTVGLFLFGRSHEDHWKTVEGSVVGLLNAKVMPQKDNSSNELSLSVDNSQKLIVLGKSKDLGWCKGKRKDGASCTMFVNKADSEWCDFHIQSQYKKQCAKRTDLQASFSGLNPTAAMKKATQNVIYGGKMFNATSSGGNRSQPKNPNKKMILKSLGAKYADFIQEELKPKCVTLLGKDKLEDDTLVSVSGATKEFHSLLSKPTPGSQNFIRHMVEAEKAKDAVPVAAADLIKQHKLQINSSIKMRKASLENSRAGSSNKENNLCLSNGISGKSRNSDDNLKSRQLMLLEKMKKEMKSAKEVVKSPSGEGNGPQLEVDFNPEGLIDLDVDTQQDSFKSKSSARMTREELAKAKAVALIKRKGKLEKKDPNETQKTKKPLDERALKEIRKRTEANRKSSSDETTEGEEPQKKKRKVVFGEVVDLDSDEMKEVLGATSIYEGALRELEVEMEERYFSQMEAKEKLELRMDAIKEKQCKVVSCKQCKFTWFCASSLCKAENHKLFWHEATQRFFKCYDCNTRTITFFRYPTRHCRNCRSGKFVRVSMLNVREKDDNQLLLRGEERKWVM